METVEYIMPVGPVEVPEYEITAWDGAAVWFQNVASGPKQVKQRPKLSDRIISWIGRHHDNRFWHFVMNVLEEWWLAKVYLQEGSFAFYYRDVLEYKLRRFFRRPFPEARKKRCLRCGKQAAVDWWGFAFCWEHDPGPDFEPEEAETIFIDSITEGVEPYELEWYRDERGDLRLKFRQ